MTDRDVLVELQQQHGIRVKLEDGCELPGWAERMIANALRQPDFRAAVAAALAELRNVWQRRKNAVEDTIMEIALRDVLDELDAVVVALGLESDAFDALIASRPDVLEMLADEALEEKK